VLNPTLVENFVGTFLLPKLDNPAPIPSFHRELWELCSEEDKLVAIAAPRGHAKSTSVTLSFVLTSVLFKEKSFVIIVSDTETQATQFLGDIKMELQDNQDIIDLFGINPKFIKDNEKDIIVQFNDGHKFRIMAKGSEQKLRGTKWNHKRPDLIIGDDLENDEIVMNQERREKFRYWFFNALVPTLSDNGQIRIVGTILHLDSLLERLLGDPEWTSKRFRAHNEDFSEILWPERFSRERLEGIRRSYVSQGMPDGYSQEYLNYPIDEDNAYFNRKDFKYYHESELDNRNLNYYAAVDFAISQKEHADFTVICVVGVDYDNNMYVVDVRRGRWDAKQIIDEMMEVQIKYSPEIFTAEEGMIRKSIGPFLRDEMFKKGVFININTETPINDKQVRARSIQARMRAGGIYFDKEADWYPGFEQELIRFPRDVHDDQVDAFAWIGLTLDKYIPGLTWKEQAEEEWAEEFEDDEEFLYGKCSVGGY